MTGYIDLHNHWIPGVDDGAPTLAEATAILRALAEAGFNRIIGTPHMRPGMFDTDKQALETAYKAALPHVVSHGIDVKLELSCEHFLDDIVFSRILAGEGLPFPGNHALLLEWGNHFLPTKLSDRLFDLRRRGFRPVVAHPERYRVCWDDLSSMVNLVDQGVVLLMDAGAVVGMYGRGAQSAAERMLDAGLYYAACSDAHRVSDVDEVVAGVERIRSLVGRDEAEFMLREGPERILLGTVDL